MFFCTTIGMGIRSWEWEGMHIESKKSFSHISNDKYVRVTVTTI